MLLPHRFLSWLRDEKGEQTRKEREIIRQVRLKFAEDLGYPVFYGLDGDILLLCYFPVCLPLETAYFKCPFSARTVVRRGIC